MDRLSGLLFGFVLSLGAGRAFRSVLFGITPTDAVTYLGVFLVLAITSLLACYLPARRDDRSAQGPAARVDVPPPRRQSFGFSLSRIAEMPCHHRYNRQFDHFCVHHARSSTRPL